MNSDEIIAQYKLTGLLPDNLWDGLEQRTHPTRVLERGGYTPAGRIVVGGIITDTINWRNGGGVFRIVDGSGYLDVYFTSYLNEFFRHQVVTGMIGYFLVAYDAERCRWMLKKLQRRDQIKIKQWDSKKRGLK